jgi:thiamine kinase-like enzyme
MSPSDYIRVRLKAPVEDPSYSEIVDTKPYFPFLNVDANDEESIKNAAVEIIRSMHNASDPSLPNYIGGRVTRIIGGITNRLYKIDLPRSDSVLVRIFGAPGLIDRDVENSNYAALAKRGIAPPYHGRFANGRVEGWLDMRPLEVLELGDFSKQIALQLASLHVNFEPETKEEPTMWHQLHSWMDQALVARFKNEADEQRAADLDLASLPAELERLQESVVPKETKIAFCHNDLLAANILVSIDSTEIQLIDFEYGGLNYIAFDIANHFNEYAGGTDNGIPQYDRFPNEEKQLDFIRAYLLAVSETDLIHNEVEAFQREIRAFVLVNHLYWGLWAVNQASVEGCDGFDYLLYAKHRISRFRTTKI